MGDVAEHRERDPRRLQLAYHKADKILDGGDDYLERNWVAEIGLRNLYRAVSRDYFGRPGATITGFGGVVPGTGIFPGATENVYSISNATSRRSPGRTTCASGSRPSTGKFYRAPRVGPRGGFTFNGRATGATNNPANATADFLLGYCSGCTGQFGGARLELHVADLCAVHRRHLAGEQPAHRADGPPLGVARALARGNDIEASFDPASGKIAYHKVPPISPPALQPLVIAQDNFSPAGIVRRT